MTDSNCTEALVSIRIMDIDYYMLSLDKYSPDVVFQAARLAIPDAQLLPKLPTVRIFGTTPAGQKACLHLHGIYPYFYIPVPAGMRPEDAVPTSVRLWSALDAALATSMAGMYPAGELGPNRAEPSVAANRPRFVANVEPVLRTSIYGFTPGPQLFFRISLYNPRLVQRLAAIIRSGEGLPAEFMGLQPFESNMSFTLQVLTDYSLTGMGYINLSSCTFRLPLPRPLGHRPPSGASLSIKSQPLHERFFTAGMLSQESSFLNRSTPRRSRSELELDAFADAVLNATGSSQEPPPGQISGPDAFAARTLKVLWDEEQRRTGKKPFVPVDKPRSVLAGPSLSEPRLAMKLASLLEGRSLELGTGGENEMDSFEDVVALLDGPAVDGLEKEPEDMSEGSVDISEESSGDDSDLIPCEEDWNDIHVSTQDDVAGQMHIPQGDGAGDSDCEEGKFIPTSKSRPSRRQKGTRRRRVVGGYQPLSLGSSARPPSRHLPVERAESSRREAKGMAVGLDPGSMLQVSAGNLECGPSSGPAQEPGSRIGLPEGVEIPSRDDAESSEAESDWSSVRKGAGPQDPVLTASGPERKELVALGRRKTRKGVVEPSAVLANDFIDHTRAVCEQNQDSGEFVLSGAPSAEDAIEVDLASPSDEVAEAESQRNTCGGDFVGANISASPSRGVCENGRILKPVREPPSRCSVVGEFGPGATRQSIVHVAPFYGRSQDAADKSRTVAGMVRRIPVGGLKGLRAAECIFQGDSLSHKLPAAFAMTPVHPPPSRQMVTDDVEFLVERQAPTRQADSSGKRKGHIDAAGRYVPLADAPGWIEGSATPISYMSDPTALRGPRVIRRRVGHTANGDDEESSQESEGEAELPSFGNTLQQTPLLTRPSSPKYDERSFFPASHLRAKAVPGCSLPPAELGSSPLFKNRGESTACFPYSGGGESTANRKSGQCQNLTSAFVEIVASSHGERLPDPRLDSVLAVCVVFRDERGRYRSERDEQIILLDENILPPGFPPLPVGAVTQYQSERELFSGLAKVLQEKDPDILCGFETQTMSVGYLIDRASVIEHEFPQQISRVVDVEGRNFVASSSKFWGESVEESAGARYFRRKGADVKIPGRHVINAWRVVRKEVKLGSYSFEGVTFEVLNRVIPKHEPAELEKWIRSGIRSDRALLHLSDKARTCMEIVDKLDIFGRTGELARVYGIEFMSVLTRGSQYRVESMLARVGHPRGFVLLSAQRDQVFDQPAVECLPLVMEPLSNFYHDPVIVLDFQSLYPSMIIAHNLCFSTNLGNINRMSSWCQEQQLGVLRGYRAPSEKSLRNEFGVDPAKGIFVAPNGEMFVTASHRRGVLPQMLEEVLFTRVMVKTAMKEVSQGDGAADELLKRLNARQFAAKMLANVTYGFAAASATGRMPCAGLADAIVQCGRDSLEEIIRFVEDELVLTTGAKVVYGDTDSLFVRVPGASKAEAFAVGRRITEKAESMFPTPVRLQLEKVYHPCMLVTKKRYVGYSFSSEETSTPVFDAKGIETVRRDSCPLVQKTMERALRVMFESRNVSRVKSFFQRTCNRIQRNGISLSDFIFRKEVRLGSYKKVLPPAAVVATKAMENDPRAAPRYGERVAFVVIFGGPGAALNNSVVSPSEMLKREAVGSARLHTTYYITKQLIPSLDRLFSLIGADINAWFAELPRAYFQPLSIASSSRIPSYFPPVGPCLICRRRSVGLVGVCQTCRIDVQGVRSSLYLLSMRQRLLETKRVGFNQACLTCVGRVERDIEEVKCVSLDCNVRFAKHRLGLRDMRSFLDTYEGLGQEAERR